MAGHSATGQILPTLTTASKVRAAKEAAATPDLSRTNARQNLS